MSSERNTAMITIWKMYIAMFNTKFTTLYLLISLLEFEKISFNKVNAGQVFCQRNLWIIVYSRMEYLHPPEKHDYECSENCNEAEPFFLLFPNGTL